VPKHQAPSSQWKRRTPVEVAGLLVVGNAGQYKRAVVDIIDHRHDLAVLTLIGNNNAPSAYAGFPMGNQLLNTVHSPTYSATATTFHSLAVLAPTRCSRGPQECSKKAASRIWLPSTTGCDSPQWLE
jgi:hypothetical protein